MRGWAAAVAEALARRARLAGAARRLMLRGLGLAWNAWCDAADAARARRELAHAALAAMMLRSLRLALNRW